MIRIILGYAHSIQCISRLMFSSIQTNLLFIFILFMTTNVHSQDEPITNLPLSTVIETLSEDKVLAKAIELKNSNSTQSLALAKEALRLSTNNNNQAVQAQTHHFIGELTQSAKKINQSLYHYLQATQLFKKLDDKNAQINASIDYSKLLIAKKEFNKADDFIDEMIAVAKDHEDPRQIGRTLTVKGNELYEQKNYKGAIEQYKAAVPYLSQKETNIQKILARTYTNLAESYKRLKNREETAFYYKKALDLYSALRNKRSIARTLNTLAEAERYLGNLVIALDYSTRGLEIHDQINDPEGRAKALTGAGIIYRHIGRYEKSLKHIYEAHIYYKKINNKSGIAKTSNQIGLIYTRLKQFDQARYFYQLTIDLSNQDIEQKTIASALRELAVIELDADNYESAELMAKGALKIYESEGDKSKQSTTARIIANIYRDQKRTPEAIAYYRKSLALAVERKSKLYQTKSLIPLASTLIGIDTNEAIELLNDALNLSKEINNKSHQLYSYRLLKDAEKQQGNIVKSLEYAEKEIALMTVIQKEREDSELVLQKAQLHSHKMEIELENLREKAVFSDLELAKKNNEIEISQQSRTITELELIKNKYANIALVLLLAMCVLLVVFIYRRFVASNKRNRELDYLAARDPLTNCYNRRILFDHLDKDFSLEGLTDYCIIMADIDNFKKVNDTYGHRAGDIVLRDVATIFQGCVRKNDIVARYGGEEFCIILHRVAHVQAMRIAESMRYKVEKSVFGNIKVTCSFGVTSIEFNAQTSSEIIEQADNALYESKRSGRNRSTLWKEELCKSNKFT